MTILEDTRQQAEKHALKHQYFEEQGIRVRRCCLFVGDYTFVKDQSICVDTKKDLQEIIGDVTKDHDRFREEMIRAQEEDIKLYILCEEGLTDIEQVKDWINPRKKRNPKAMNGEQLYKIMKTQEQKYGVKYLFCKKEETGQKIIELLKGN